MSNGSTDSNALDRRALWVLGGLLGAGGFAMFILFPPGAPRADGGVGSGFVATPPPPTQAPPAEEGAKTDAPAPQPEPFVETERVRGKAVYDEASRSVRIEDPLGEVLARVSVDDQTGAIVGSSFDKEAKVIFVDLKGGQRLEIPEDVYNAMPSKERYALYYPRQGPTE